jgi:hypothetical protein
MLAIAGLLGSSFIVVSLVVGWRLLLLARRTRQLPELAVGLGLFLMGGFGWPLMVAAQRLLLAPDGVRVGLALASTLLMAVGEIALAVFTWRVFRPQARWARLLVLAVGLGFALCAAGQAFRPGYAAIALEQARPWWLYQLLPTFVLGWSGLESIHEARRCARRQRLGLSSPIVTSRFRLWGACTLTCSLLTLVTALAGPAFQTSAAGLGIITPVTLFAAVALWFAFLPPAFYQQRLLRSAAAA